ncbi:hypothetical protein ACI3PL_21230, partial [Lacticaseibacillus paracasei]
MNQFVTADEQMDIRADYEKTLKKHQDDPILVATDVKATIDIVPEQRLVRAHVVQQMTNKFSTPITKMLVHMAENSRDIV